MPTKEKGTRHTPLSALALSAYQSLIFLGNRKGFQEALEVPRKRIRYGVMARPPPGSGRLLGGRGGRGRGRGREGGGRISSQQEWSCEPSPPGPRPPFLRGLAVGRPRSVCGGGRAALGIVRGIRTLGITLITVTSTKTSKQGLSLSLS